MKRKANRSTLLGEEREMERDSFHFYLPIAPRYWARIELDPFAFVALAGFRDFVRVNGAK